MALLKAQSPILVTELGIDNVVSELAPQKAWALMLVRVFEIVNSVIELRSEKAEKPILVTELGMVKVVSDLKSEKELAPIL